MNGWGWAAIGILAALACGYRIRRGYLAWRDASRRLAAIQEEFKTPSPGPQSMPGDGPAPVPGNEDALPRGVPAGGPHHAPAPGPRPRLLMSSRFYSDGVVFVDDHIKRQTTRFDPPAEDGAGLSDEAIARFLDGHH